jgi:hypothetical protein
MNKITGKIKVRNTPVQLTRWRMRSGRGVEEQHEIEARAPRHSVGGLPRVDIAHEPVVVIRSATSNQTSTTVQHRLRSAGCRIVRAAGKYVNREDGELKDDSTRLQLRAIFEASRYC